MKEYRVLLIRNRLDLDISDSVFKTIQYFAERTPMKIIVEEMIGDIDINIGEWGVCDKDGVSLLGTLGYRQYLEENKIDGSKYNGIILAYDPSKSARWKADKGNVPGIRHWTHWETYKGAALIEIGVMTAWGLSDVYRVITHELLHAFHQATRLNDNPTVDTMDMYDDEMIPESPNGNRARNILEIARKNAWDQVESQTLLMSIYRLLRTQVQLYQMTQAKKMITKKIELMAEAIREHEGWYKGSRSYRNNNPGNFKFNPSGYRSVYGVVGKDKDGFAIFPSCELGWLYLINFLTACATGKSTVFSPSMNMYEFFAKYAPSSDNNDPKHYAEVVASKMGVEPSFIIKDLLS